MRARVPDAPETLAREASVFVGRLRALALVKAPGVSETLDWLQTLHVLGHEYLDADVVEATAGALVKHREDVEQVSRASAEGLVDEVKQALE